MLTGKIARVAAIATLYSISIPFASAASLELSHSLLSTDSANAASGSGAATTVASTGSYDFSHSFAGTSSAFTGSDEPYRFYDDFVFIVGEKSSVSATINLNQLMYISGLQVRVYNAVYQASLPVLGTPAGGELSGWSSPLSYSPIGSGTVTVLSAMNFAAGTYVLELRGSVGGTFFGSYAGALGVGTPVVPVPGTAWLFGSALCGLAGIVRRKSRSAIASSR